MPWRIGLSWAELPTSAACDGESDDVTAGFYPEATYLQILHYMYMYMYMYLFKRRNHVKLLASTLSSGVAFTILRIDAKYSTYAFRIHHKSQVICILCGVMDPFIAGQNTARLQHKITNVATIGFAALQVLKSFTRPYLSTWSSYRRVIWWA